MKFISGSLKPRYLLIALLLLQVILGAAYSLSTSLWQGHEQDYYNVVRFLAQNGHLPTSSDYPNGDAEIRQATQPPLYFLTAYPVVALLDDAQPVPPGTQPTLICVGDNGYNTPVLAYPITSAYVPPVSGAVAAAYGLRLLNVLIGMAGVLFTYLAGRALFPRQPSVALAAAALLAFNGTMMRLNSSINNDTLLVTLSAANVLICARLAARFNWKLLLPLLISVGLALLTRLDGWALLVFDVPFVLLIGLIQWRAPLRTRLRGLALILGVFVLVVIAIVGFNLISYGSVFGRYGILEAVISNSLNHFNIPWVTVSGVAQLTYTDYQTPLQSLQPRAAFVKAYGLLLVIAFVGFVWAFVWALYRRNRAALRALSMLLGVLLIAVFLVIYRNALAATTDNTTLYNFGLIYAPLRYYGSGLPALALLMSAGLATLVPERFRLSRLNLPAAAVAGCWLIVTVLGAVVAIQTKPVIPVTSANAVAARPGLTTVQGQQVGGVPQILAYSVRERPTDGMVDLTLYLTTSQPMSENYFAQVQLTDGHERVSCQFLPARGAYPTTLWQPGEIVTTDAVIPNCGAPMGDSPELSLNWRGTSSDGTISSVPSPPLLLASLSPGLHTASSCPDKLGIIAGGYQIVKFNSPSSIPVGETYLPSLNWLILNPTPTAYVRRFVFTNEQNGQRYTCTGTPAPQAYDVATWHEAQQVFFDVCSFRFPTDAPLGTYRVEVGILNARGLYFPAVDSNGSALPDGLVTVGEISLIS